MSAVPRLDALGPRGSFRARKRLTVHDVAGAPAAELSLVPALFVDRAAKALHRARPLPADERVAAVIRAAHLFATADLDGQSVTAYERAVSRVGGVPLAVVRATTAAIAARLTRIYDSLTQARPAGTAEDWRSPLTRTGGAVWTRRGETFAVLAAGNHPGTQSLWPEALALGYRVAVRPSRREPFTPHRLVTALRTAGFGDDQIVLLPTDHAEADTLVRAVDRSLVYGGEDVVRKYGGDPAVLLQGPGRSKILITADTDWREHLDTVVASVAGHGGTGCVNTTTVLVEGADAATALAERLAERLAVLPALRPEDDKAVLPVQPLDSALAIERYLLSHTEGTRAWLGGDGIAEELGDGSAALRPAVHQLERADAPQASIELPFPCVWVAPWTVADGIAPLRGSLVVTALTRDTQLLDDLVTEPSIGNVHVGDHPTYWMGPGLPHDGYLAEFLMRSKTVIRD
ncbi:aldehyde dehydrogenase family protein [Streptomyces sp. G-G2]|uniref:aldehyde dehydrogenase family protein n=1 Tax=Streptomyces sp. G-G2 TaxID=3046201 RepID=UPI0024B9C599|nr:aldehyde dehydrogenase family protein [Streptomyces sp. G-G2]MDJ0382914.1 aldehyde dehydrogenase family protein [Streptomyces sp. G-G2]